MKTLAIANAKGGTGKTTVAANVAMGLALRGNRTLLVDLDFQANSTKWLLNIRHRPEPHIAGVSPALEGGDIRELPSPLTDRLWIAPADEGLPSAEYKVAYQPAGQTNLRMALRRKAASYDYCVIDCAPNLGVAVVSGLCAATAVFVPVPPGFMGLSGLSDLEAALHRLRAGYSIATRVAGLILFAVDTREALSDATRQLLAAHGKGRLMASEIRVSTAAKRHPDTHETVWSPGADPRGAEDYPKLLNEMLRRLGGKRKS